MTIQNHSRFIIIGARILEEDARKYNRRMGSLDTARNYCPSAETTLDFSTVGRNGKEMEEGENKRKNLQYLKFDLRTKEENKPPLQCDESGEGEKLHRICELIGLSKFSV